MQEVNAQPDAEPTPAPAVTYYWIAAIEKPNGDKFHCHATAEVTPGVHTRGSVTRDVLAFLKQRHGEFVLLSLSLEPDALPRPQATG